MNEALEDGGGNPRFCPSRLVQSVGQEGRNASWERRHGMPYRESSHELRSKRQQQINRSNTWEGPGTGRRPSSTGHTGHRRRASYGRRVEAWMRYNAGDKPIHHNGDRNAVHGVVQGIHLVHFLASPMAVPVVAFGGAQTWNGRIASPMKGQTGQVLQFLPVNMFVPGLSYQSRMSSPEVHRTGDSHRMRKGADDPPNSLDQRRSPLRSQRLGANEANQDRKFYQRTSSDCLPNSSMARRTSDLDPAPAGLHRRSQSACQYGGGSSSYQYALTLSAPSSPMKLNQDRCSTSMSSLDMMHFGIGGIRRDSSADSGDDAAPDLERFLRVACPTIRRPQCIKSLANLKLQDIWAFFEKPSALGLECPVLGGPRGPSTAYFVPFLSSVQLFEPLADVMNEEQKGGENDEAQIFEYLEGLDSWPRKMRRVFSWSASAHVAERAPLCDQIGALCGVEGEEHLLKSTKIANLHPYSWFAVAWYPLYRIPEAPLSARFLTFHSLAPLWEEVCSALRYVGGGIPFKGFLVSDMDQYPSAHNPSYCPDTISMHEMPCSQFGSLVRQQFEGKGCPSSYCAAAILNVVDENVCLQREYEGANQSTAAVVYKKDPSSQSSLSSMTPTGVSFSFPGSPFTCSETEGDYRGTSWTQDVPPVDSSSSYFNQEYVSKPACTSLDSVISGAGPSLSTTMENFNSSRSDSPFVFASSLASGSNNSVGSALSHSDTVCEFCSADLRSNGNLLPRSFVCGSDDCDEDSQVICATTSIQLPPVGLCWHVASCSQGPRLAPENWVQTLKAAMKTDDAHTLGPAGVWERQKVIQMDYPLDKGGPLSWEIQMEELDEGAARLSSGVGLVPCSRASADDVSSLDEEGHNATCCPDFEFFKSRKR